MTVGTHHKQIRVLVAHVTQQDFRNARHRPGQHGNLGLDAVADKHLAQRAPRIGPFGAIIRRIDDGDVHKIGLLEQRQCAADGRHRLGSLIPRDHHTFAKGIGQQGFRKQKHRGTAFEQDRLQNGFCFWGTLGAIGMRQQDKIGKPCLGRYDCAQAAQLGHGGFCGPAHILPVQNGTGCGIQLFGILGSAVHRGLGQNCGPADIRIPDLGPVDAKRQHIKMGILPCSQKDGRVQSLRYLRRVGENCQQGLVGHGETPLGYRHS